MLALEIRRKNVLKLTPIKSNAAIRTLYARVSSSSCATNALAFDAHVSSYTMNVMNENHVVCWKHKETYVILCHLDKVANRRNYSYQGISCKKFSCSTTSCYSGEKIEDGANKLGKLNRLILGRRGNRVTARNIVLEKSWIDAVKVGEWEGEEITKIRG